MVDGQTETESFEESMLTIKDSNAAMEAAVVEPTERIITAYHILKKEQEETKTGMSTALKVFLLAVAVGVLYLLLRGSGNDKGAKRQARRLELADRLREHTVTE